MNKDYIAPVAGFNPSRASSSIHTGTGCLSPSPFAPVGGVHFAKHDPIRGRDTALLRFVSFVPFTFPRVNVAGFLYQIRLLRFVSRSPFPFCLMHPVYGFVTFPRLQRPRKTLARSPPPFPASLRYTALGSASPRPRRCCFSPPVTGASAAAAADALARLQRTSDCKVTDNFGNCKFSR